MQINYLAVFAGGIISFLLGALWYSKLFARQWMAEMKMSEEELRKQNKPINYFSSFILGLISSFILANIIMYLEIHTLIEGIEIAILCWIGFTGATSYAQNMFAGKSQKLWMINSGYYLISFIINGAIFAVWK